MTSLAERIAAKKAAEAALKAAQGATNEEGQKNSSVASTAQSSGDVRAQNAGGQNTQSAQQQEAQVVSNTVESNGSSGAAGVSSLVGKQVVVTIRKRTQAEAEALAKETAPTVDSQGKPLSGFALMKARKELVAKYLAEDITEEVEDGTEAANSIGQSVASSTSQGANGSGEAQGDKQLVQSTAVQDSAQSVPGDKGVAEVAAVSTKAIAEAVQSVIDTESEEWKAATPEAQQAYADIKPRIDALSTMMGDDIKGAMAELKKTLMQNPNAVQLMLPSDIGQMVIALRKMTGVELAAKAAGKATSTKGKKKEIALTAEELDKAWEEL